MTTGTGRTRSTPPDRASPTRALSDAPLTSAGPGGVAAGAALPGSDVVSALGTSGLRGLTGDEVRLRQARWGPNAFSSHRARFLSVLWHQVRSPLLGLLLVAAVASFFVGERGAAVITGVIVSLSVGLGLVNEYRAE